MTDAGTRAQEVDRILDEFEDAVEAATDQLSRLREPSADSDEQKLFSAELLAWVYDGGWVRWQHAMQAIGEQLLASRAVPRGVRV